MLLPEVLVLMPVVVLVLEAPLFLGLGAVWPCGGMAIRMNSSADEPAGQNHGSLPCHAPPNHDHPQKRAIKGLHTGARIRRQWRRRAVELPKPPQINTRHADTAPAPRTQGDANFTVIFRTDLSVENGGGCTVLHPCTSAHAHPPALPPLAGASEMSQNFMNGGEQGRDGAAEASQSYVFISFTRVDGTPSSSNRIFCSYNRNNHRSHHSDV